MTARFWIHSSGKMELPFAEQEKLQESGVGIYSLRCLFITRAEIMSRQVEILVWCSGESSRDRNMGAISLQVISKAM